MNLWTALLVAVASGVQLAMFWYISQFSHSPPMLSVSVGSAAFFALLFAVTSMPIGATRRNILLLAVLAMLCGWLIHLDEIVTTPRRFPSASGEALRGLLWYVLLIGAPSWLSLVLATRGSIASRSSFSEFLVETLELVWVRVSCVCLLAGLQLKLLVTLEEIRAPYSFIPLSAMVAAYFLASLVHTLRPGTVGIGVLWRTLAWAAGLVLASGLCVFDADGSIHGGSRLVTDVFAFLTPVWVLRLWLASAPGVVKRSVPLRAEPRWDSTASFASRTAGFL